MDYFESDASYKLSLLTKRQLTLKAKTDARQKQFTYAYCAVPLIKFASGESTDYRVCKSFGVNIQAHIYGDNI